MQIADYQLTVYAITDRTWLKPGQTLASQVEQAILGGATIIQLREKKATPEEFLALAREVKVITDQYGVPLIINDNPETAVAVDAAGVHIGQSDGEAEKVRAVIGPNRILGVSARTVEQAKNAELVWRSIWHHYQNRRREHHKRDLERCVQCCKHSGSGDWRSECGQHDGTSGNRDSRCGGDFRDICTKRCSQGSGNHPKKYGLLIRETMN